MSDSIILPAILPYAIPKEWRREAPERWPDKFFVEARGYNRGFYGPFDNKKDAERLRERFGPWSYVIFTGPGGPDSSYSKDKVK